MIYDRALDFNDSSIHKMMEPGASKVVPFVSTIATNPTNVAVIMATPLKPNGDLMPGAEDVTNSDDSEVALNELLSGDVKSGDKMPYAPPGDESGFL